LQSASRARWSEGYSAGEIARALGISTETVRRWCKGAARSAALVPVQIREETRTSGSVCLVSPRGWRLEGLDLARALAVLEQLG
jgi:predicted transcriptional regulator